MDITQKFLTSFYPQKPENLKIRCDKVNTGNFVSGYPPSHTTVKFGGIYANYNSDNLKTYLRAFETAPEEHNLKPFATRIFRELPTTLAVAKLIGKNPADLHILGCSDGSEAYAYAIALKESLGKGARNKVKITGVDYTPFLVEMAKTGHLVCTDQEKIWANDHRRAPNSPLAGNGWHRYLEPSAQPENFDALVRQYPDLAQMTRDPVANISIGNGMGWYKVRPEGLPPMAFEVADMRNYVKRSPSQVKKQIYVAANSLAYIAQQQGPAGFLKVLQDIQNSNLGKETYVVVGQTEHQIFQQVPQLIQYMQLMGYAPVSKEKLRALGVDQTDKIYGDIWKVNSTVPVKLSFVT